MPTFYKNHWTGGTVVTGLFPAVCGAARGRLISNVTHDPTKVDCGRCKKVLKACGKLPR